MQFRKALALWLAAAAAATGRVNNLNAEPQGLPENTTDDDILSFDFPKLNFPALLSVHSSVLLPRA